MNGEHPPLPTTPRLNKIHVTRYRQQPVSNTARDGFNGYRKNYHGEIAKLQTSTTALPPPQEHTTIAVSDNGANASTSKVSRLVLRGGRVRFSNNAFPTFTRTGTV